MDQPRRRDDTRRKQLRCCARDPGTLWTRMRVHRGLDRTADDQRARVLVVDDEPGILRVFRRILEARYDVVTASCPLIALHAVVGSDEFDAIVCDVRMPVMTGPALHEAIRGRWPSLAERFVFVTASPPEEALRCGVPVLAKPVSRRDLLETVARIVGRRSSDASREGSRPSLAG